MKKYIMLRQCIMLSIMLFSIIFSISVASAADKTYYWDRTIGLSVAGYTTNWSTCSSNNPQNGYRVTSLGNSVSSCSNSALTRPDTGDLFLAIFPTAYSSDTQITGKAGAKFYLKSNSGSATYRFDLGYVQTGTFTSFGYVTRTGVSTSGATYTIDMSTISGTAPVGSNIALKTSVNASSGGKIYLGINGGTKNSNSGRFFVSENGATPPALTYNVTIKASPISTDITAGNNYIYNIVVNNTGNTRGNYTLGVSDSDSTNFMGSTLGTTTMQIDSGSSATTTLTVTAKSGAITGAIDDTTVTVVSVENSIYTNSTQVRTTVIGGTPTPTPTPTPIPIPTGYKIIVSSDRYSIFSPWTNKASDASLSANFTGYALLLDGDGKPVSGQSVTFKIYAGSGGTVLKATKIATTQLNGLASVQYDTYNDFSNRTDTDYGTWKIEAYMTSNSAVISSTNMKIDAGGTALGTCSKGYCHDTGTSSGLKPLSPYTAGYGSTSSRAVAAHEKSAHDRGCYNCHPGYAATKTGDGYTGDVHKNRQCSYCHGTFSSMSNGGIPKMPSCYECHPVFNSNVLNISTLANLAAGNGISVYSFNFDVKKPLAAHTGTAYSMVDSVPCLVCHGPAHNNSKPYNLAGTSDGDTENDQCWSCHTNRLTNHRSNENCVTCHTQDAHSIGTTGGGDDCIGCHTVATGTGDIYPGIDTNVFTNHKNVNTTDGTNVLTNSDCKVCHYDTTNMDNVLTKTCNECHTDSSGPIIENHRPVNGIVVNITTSASCSMCHNNSIAKYSYSANASTSHYATTTGLIGTKDCLYCHKNSANGNIWGGATDPSNSPTFSHSLTTTTKEECYSCHGDISAGTTGFHNKTLMKPPLSSVSCLDCHKLGTNMSLTKIDSSVSSAAVHKDKNCSDCHTGATTGNMNTYSVVANPPVVCTNCHTGVVEHRPSAPDVQTTISCKDCHNNDGMYTGNSGTNGTEDAVVHYLKNVTDMSTTPYGHTGLIDTSNCMNCHGSSGTYTGDINWGSPVDISTSSKRMHTETTIAECNNCHKDGTVSSLADVDFHNSALTGGVGQGPNCLSCHAGVE